MKTGRPAPRRKSAGFTLIELLIAMSILLVALIPIGSALTQMQTMSNDNVVTTRAAYLALQKAEELRRDDTNTTGLLKTVKERTVPTAPVIATHVPKLAYCFTGKSLLYDSSTPEGADGIARVLVINSNVTDPAKITRKDVLYELRFAF